MPAADNQYFGILWHGCEHTRLATPRQQDRSLPMPPDPSLAEMLAARLCHDLGGAVGTLAGTLDLVEGADGEMLALARETATALRLRLRLYSAAWGGGAEDAGPQAIAELLTGCSASPRVRFATDGLPADLVLPALAVPVVLNAALLAAEALPMGGMVRLAGDAAGIVVIPDGRRATWSTELIGALAGSGLAEMLGGGPRRVLVPLLVGQLHRAGWHAAFGFGAEPDAAPPLLLSPG